MVGVDPSSDGLERARGVEVADVAQYVPGYAMRTDPQFDEPHPDWQGNARVAVSLGVANSVLAYQTGAGR